MITYAKYIHKQSP